MEEEADDQDITDAATVIIGSELSVSERQSLRDDLINYITKMTERGGHSYNNNRGVRVRGSRYDKDFG